jgi:hypothetical protein
MPARSLRAHLLRLLLPPIAVLLAVGAVVGYYSSIEPANEAYDQALSDIAAAIAAHVRTTDADYRLDLPPEVETALRTDRYDKMFYRVLSPSGSHIAGDDKLPISERATAYDARFKGEAVRHRHRAGAVRQPDLHGARRRDHGQAHSARAGVPDLEPAARPPDRARHDGAPVVRREARPVAACAFPRS